MHQADQFEINETGFVIYPKRHIGRLISVAGAIATLQKPTSTSITKYLGYLSKGGIDKIALIELNYQLGIKVKKEGFYFKITSWGSLVSKEAVLKHMKTPICKI
jgi:hypothetical protein